MVQIPDFKLNPSQIPDSALGPSIYPGYSEQLGNSIKNFGNSVETVETNVLEVRKRAQDAAAAHQASLQDKLDLEDYSNHLKSTLPKTMDGYADSIQQWTKDRMQSNLETMPSEEARQQYQSLAGSQFTGEIVSAKSEEFKQKAIGYGQDSITMKDALANAQERNPDPKSAAESIQQYGQSVDALTGTAFTPEDAFKLKNTAKNQIAKGTIDGLYTRAQNDDKNSNTWAKQGLAIINGTDAESQRQPNGQKIRDYLTPDETGGYIRKFQEYIDTKKKINAAEVSRSMDDQIVNAQNGVPVSPLALNNLRASVSNGSVKPEAALRIQNKLMAAQSMGDTITQLNSAPISQFKSIIDANSSKVAAATAASAGSNPSLAAAKQPGYNSAETNQYQVMIQNHVSQILKQRADDPAKFTLSQPAFAYVANQFRQAGNDPDKTQAAVVSLLAAQDHQEIPASDQRVTSKARSEDIGQLLSQPDAEQSSKAFTQLEQQYGSYWPQAFKEVADDKNIQPSLWLAHYVQNPDQRAKAVAMVSNSKAIDKAYKEDNPAEVDQKALKAAVTSELREHLSAINQMSDKGGSLQLSNAFRGLVETGAQNEKVNNPSLSNSEAAAKASQLVKSNYQTVGSANSYIVAPASENKRVISTYMEENLRNPPMDQIAPQLGKPPEGVSDSQAADQYAERIKSTGRWESTPTMDGVRLVVRNSDGGTQTVMRKDGSPLVAKFKDMIHDPATVNALGKKSFFRQAFESLSDPMHSTPPTSGN